MHASDWVYFGDLKFSGVLCPSYHETNVNLLIASKTFRFMRSCFAEMLKD